MAIINKRMDEKYWMIGYDLPAETRVGASDGKKKFLNTMRKNVWQQLRRYGCVPVQQSLWNIREPDASVRCQGKMVTALEAVKMSMEEWKSDYAKEGITDINVELFPMATDHVGANYISSAEIRFVFEALQKCEKIVDEAVKKKVMKLHKYNDVEMRVQDMYNMFVEDFSTRHERWNEFEQIYMRVKRKMEDEQTGVKRFTTV